MNWNQLIVSLNKPTQEQHDKEINKIAKKEIRKYGYTLKLDHDK